MSIVANQIITGDAKSATKSGRKPLQPKNIFFFAENAIAKSKPEDSIVEKPLALIVAESNKENRPIRESTVLIQPFDASLAEELSAMRKKTERLRLDRERMDEMLKERDRVMDLKLKEILERSEIQKKLETEVDRLFRLKEIHSQSMRISPIRSLREKEQDKMNSNRLVRSPVESPVKSQTTPEFEEIMIQGEKTEEDMEESEGEDTLLPPSSSSSRRIIIRDAEELLDAESVESKCSAISDFSFKPL